MTFAVILVVIITVSLLETTASNSSEPLRIAAFNVRVFGVTKMRKSDVRNTLVKVVKRYDIILIQEIRDISGNAITSLLAEVNKVAAVNQQYNMVISKALGRSTSKEQYAFLYRKDLVSVNASYTYQDKNDVFEREPFIVHFFVPTSAVSDMVFVAIHTKPNDAVKEVDGLVDVYEDVVKMLSIKNVVIMGDLNAACIYVKDNDWKDIRLALDKRFWWLIDDCQDTSVQGQRCAYDRFIASGTELLSRIIPNSARLFNFKTAYNLTEKQAEEVSDHFPIEFHIKDRAWKEVIENMAYIFTSSSPNAAKKDVFDLRKDKFQGYTVSSVYKRSGGTQAVTIAKTVHGISEAIETIHSLRKTAPKLVQESQASLALYHLSRLSVGLNKYPYQLLTEYSSMFTVSQIKIKIQLSCDVATSITCRLILGKPT